MNKYQKQIQDVKLLRRKINAIELTSLKYNIHPEQIDKDYEIFKLDLNFLTVTILNGD